MSYTRKIYHYIKDYIKEYFYNDTVKYILLMIPDDTFTFCKISDEIESKI